MRRLFKMTEKATQALWSKLSDNSAAIPTQFLVDGDAKEGYQIYYVNEDLQGFRLIGIRSFYAVNRIIEEINETGTTEFKQHCTIGSFAYANIPLPDYYIQPIVAQLDYRMKDCISRTNLAQLNGLLVDQNEKGLAKWGNYTHKCQLELLMFN